MPRAPTPTRYDRMAAAAAKGDVDGVFAALSDGRLPCEDDCAQAFEHSRAALETLAADDPRKLVQFRYQKMLAFQGSLLLRAQRYVEQSIKESDQRYGLGDIPPQIAKDWLPRVSRIQQEVRETSRSLGAVLHTFSLAEEGTKRQRQYGERVIPLVDRLAELAAQDREASGE